MDKHEAESKPAEEPVEQSRSVDIVDNFRELSKKHNDWLAGEYDPTSEELEQFAKMGKYNIEAFLASKTKAEYTVAPYVERVETDIMELMKIGESIDMEHITDEDATKLVQFIAERYGLKNAPKVILDKELPSLGSYDWKENTIVANPLQHTSIADFITSLSHECWHAKQNEERSAPYAYNLAFYKSPDMDERSYELQLIELEANAAGDAIGDLYREWDLDTHPEKIAKLQQEYYERFILHAPPKKQGDGADSKYLKLAHERASKLDDFLSTLFYAAASMRKYFVSNRQTRQ